MQVGAISLLLVITIDNAAHPEGFVKVYDTRKESAQLAWGKRGFLLRGTRGHSSRNSTE